MIENEDVKKKRRYRKYRQVGKGVGRYGGDETSIEGKWKKEGKGVKSELVIVDCGHITTKYKINKQTNESMCLGCYRKLNKSKVKNYEPSKRGTLSSIFGYLGCFSLVMTIIIFFGKYFSLIDMEILYSFFDMIHINLRLEDYNVPRLFILFDIVFPVLAFILGYKQFGKETKGYDITKFEIIGKMSPATLGCVMGARCLKNFIIYWFGINIFIWLMDILPKIWVISGIIFCIVFSIIEYIYHEYPHLMVLKRQKREKNKTEIIIK